MLGKLALGHGLRQIQPGFQANIGRDGLVDQLINRLNADSLKHRGHVAFVQYRPKGAKWFDSAKALAQNVDVIISMVGYPQDVAEIYLGENGVIKNLKPQSIIIDMTTSSPKLAQEIYQEAQKYEIKSLDAPVSGGDVGAKNGTLAIMVGGDKEVYEEVLPIFEAMGCPC